MSHFFIERPIFAWVIAIFIILGGVVATQFLPVEQYPSVASPQIAINVTYPGASAETLQKNVLSIIERAVNGVDDLDYIETTANANGSGDVTLTFNSGTDEDLAQVDVQNKLSVTEARLPQAVRDQGIQVVKSRNNFLMFVTAFATSPDVSQVDVADYVMRNIQPALQRIDGVGNAMVFGSEPAMRIWLNPAKMRSYGLSSSEIAAAVEAQNEQIPAGSIGAAPGVQGQLITATIFAGGQLKTVAEFENIIVRSNTEGSTVRLKDVAKVEISYESYATSGRLDGKPMVGTGIQLSTDGNAVEVAANVKKTMEELEQYFPEGIGWKIPYETATFVELSIEKVVETLVEAMVLVFLVMLLFLQNIRYTIIPTIVVPISLLGALGMMVIFGLSVNVLTMFAIVLVIGIVVDDAIVVVENVERLMSSEGLSPREAAHKSMDQISGAVIGITLVLISVFLPLAFFPGASGNIYRQFSLVMMSAIAFSAFLALSLTPSLCATILKPVKEEHEAGGFYGLFNRFFNWLTVKYEAALRRAVRFSYGMMFIFLCITAFAAWLYPFLPGSFLPQEDQGYIILNVQLPVGATRSRTEEVMKQIEGIILQQEEVQTIVDVMGFSFSGQGENMGLAFVPLTDWSKRTRPEQSASAFAARMMVKFGGIRDAFVFALSPPPISELGNSSGFEMRLEDRSSAGHETLLAARNLLLGATQGNPVVTSVRPEGLEDGPILHLNIDRDAAYAQGVPMSNIISTLSQMLGSAYLGDFPNRDRMQRVKLMAQADFRMQSQDILKLTVHTNTGGDVPLSELISTEWKNGQMQARRYQGYPAMALSGQATPGHSTGEAMAEMQKLKENLPQMVAAPQMKPQLAAMGITDIPAFQKALKGIAIDWTGLSLEEIRAGNMSLYLYGFALLSVFLCLAALYESWSIPLSVLLVVPFGFLGVVAAVLMRGMTNDIYFQVGLITVIGLSAKNAILIVEFAKDLQAEGKRLVSSVLMAAHLRYRPIIMTSFAFIAGVVPLVRATGASSASQREIGTAVMGGMISATIFSVLFVPIFYIVIRKLFGYREPPHGFQKLLAAESSPAPEGEDGIVPPLVVKERMDTVVRNQQGDNA
ncbi:efflux RND transporter permease subunit [Desulforhopalus vacuolatus]|uniref:efflux RND transporter permease subunit n=1 Tax=Desulforhopalus vacuolatus TaxID=40414 RepID=UPI001964642A|nr:efflux RND transporter permease subunit [Desulforhopalus vacuolatus]MBM9519524.1 efflux RND transporter permease subunit [Desulforhopalus vacuolatus]